MTDVARVIATVNGAVAEVRLNRPDVRNAMDDQMRNELMVVLDDLNQDEAVRVVVLTGEGTAFCSGGDISAMKSRLDTGAGQLGLNGWKRVRRVSGLMKALHDLDKITIAAVNGPAFGFGMDLALCCDFLVAADAAVFSMSYVLRGLIPDGGGMYFLPRRVGLARAKELIFSGRRVDAEEALALGIVDRVVPLDQLSASAAAWALELAPPMPTAVSLTKAILNRTFELSADEVFALGAQATAICYTSDEHRDSVTQFLEATKARKGSS
ncbi:MAG: hypothetical protein QOK05_621 [Chloroflexota bacterium]|nr:hypothetical protein [Chloroflexota bacterium]